jgi:hypothetical protein
MIRLSNLSKRQLRARGRLSTIMQMSTAAKLMKLLFLPLLISGKIKKLLKMTIREVTQILEEVKTTRKRFSSLNLQFFNTKENRLWLIITQAYIKILR